MKFTRMLPALLKRTNVVLEIRDSRLPLTSINRTLEGVLTRFSACLSEEAIAFEGIWGSFAYAFLYLHGQSKFWFLLRLFA